MIVGASVPVCAALLGWMALAVARPDWSEWAYFFIAVLFVSLGGLPHSICGAASILPRRWRVGARVIVGVALGIAVSVGSFVVAMTAFAHASLRLGYIE